MQEINNVGYTFGGFVEPDAKLATCKECKEPACTNENDLCCLCAREVGNEQTGGSKEYVNKLKKTNPKQLAKDHWAYIEALLNEHGVLGVDIIGFHYRTAFEHGYKHAMEDK